MSQVLQLEKDLEDAHNSYGGEESGVDGAQQEKLGETE
jgi:hypothetical protein